MRKIGLLLISVLYFAGNVDAQTSVKSVVFRRCVDGDTAIFVVDGEEQKFRFLAIDTPESVHPTKAIEEYAKDASEYTCNKLTNAKEVVVEYENSGKTDKYGRHLGWIWVDGSLLQKELIDVGYAKVAYIYGKYRYTNSLCLAQSIAKKEKYGLWSTETEDGYCSTVDLTDVQNNIDYSNIGDVEKNEEDNEKNYEAFDKLEDIQKKISNILDNNDSKIQNVLYYIFIGLGIIILIIKEFKK